MDSNIRESYVACQHHTGAEIRASLLRLTRYVAAFEVYTPGLGLCLSDVLTEFRVVMGERTVYAGRAIVTSAVNTGPLIVCEAALDDEGFKSTAFDPAEAQEDARCSFRDFLGQWEKSYRVLPEFKIAVADMSTFLVDLRLWLEQIELTIRASPAGSRAARELEVVQQIAEQMTPAFDEMHDRLEEVSEGIDPDLRPAHHSFCRRQLHGLTMCSPFAYRTYHKPLGYAGDYEMVNMILRNPFEGASLYAKVVNNWFLSQWPAKAHRNRITYLKHLLEQESLRGACRQKPVRVLNLGCGPAHEVTQFMADSALSDYVDLVLLDFNEETLQYAADRLQQAKANHQRRTGLAFKKKSVHQLIKESVRPAATNGERYDLIYCAGLFDYLADRTCKQLMSLFHQWLAPGGLVAATNVDDCKPFRHMLEFVLDWHLVYRGTPEGHSLLPEAASPDDCIVRRDVTGVNVFMEARRPNHA